MFDQRAQPLPSYGGPQDDLSVFVVFGWAKWARQPMSGIVEPMQAPVFSYELTILERHLDTFGHVNNATYLDLFEEARWDLITKNGYGLDEIQRRQAGPTVLEIGLRFMREIRNRERITVKSWTESYTGKMCRFQQQMVNEKQEVCCAASFVVGLFDLRARKLLLPTPEWLRAVGLEPSDPAPV